MRRKKIKKNPVSKFYPEHYSTSELKAITKGTITEAYAFTMNRIDMPKTVKQKASKELKEREKKYGKKM